MTSHHGTHPGDLGDGSVPTGDLGDRSLSTETLAPQRNSVASERPTARALRHALWVCLAPALWVLFGSRLATFGTDSAHAYWNVWRAGPYTLPPGSPDAYNYSPVFAQVIKPLTLLPWPAFLAVWSLLLTAALVWLLWPVTPRWRWLVLGYVVPPALLIGNIEAFLAVSAVVGFARPASWAFPLLTKVTPGLGPIWFAVRREWRSAATAVLATAAIVAVSYVTAPQLWADWISFLVSTPTPPTQQHYPPLWLRLPVAVAVVSWAARKGRRSAVAIAMLIAMPLWSSGVLILLAALPRLRRLDAARDASDRPAGRPGWPA